ncbi:hypothetical protein E3Q22_01429 [Wallemia mellicola]|uniref:cAMP-independent regulatory protein pac2 n=1 Tax=Wallemia mellicola TaxID=1708541 RepID=A0A4T0MDH4_9BASI|nr:hypothetical protein E3Q22_01429 [Wallemia mellicola]TIC16154.1 hypothetical protein E3Q14_00148 [Wallemia mellicola]TIC17457.1 hypothetical protein E3Q15_00693 [Wallemia mellicola]TIC57303.1 hypothetical protein E3Q05_01264 [Wallemia mellicola]
MPTYNGQIINNLDAVILLKAVQADKLKVYRRRLTSSERNSIKTGDVFIWEECQGMQRWTDGKRWGPSRVQGGFLWYKEIEVEELFRKASSLVKQTYSLPQTLSNSLPDPKLHLVCYTNSFNKAIRPSQDSELSMFKDKIDYTTPSVLTSPSVPDKRPEPINIVNPSNRSFSPPPTPPQSFSNAAFTDPFHGTVITPPVSATRADFNQVSLSARQTNRRASHPNTNNASAIQAGAYAATLASRSSIRRGSSPYPSPRRNTSIFESRPSFSQRKRSNFGVPPTINTAQGANVPPPMTSAPATYTSQTIPTTAVQQRPSSSHSQTTADYVHSNKYMPQRTAYQPLQQQPAYAQRASLPPITASRNNSTSSITHATSIMSLCDEDKRQLDSFKFTGWL